MTYSYQKCVLGVTLALLASGCHATTISGLWQQFDDKDGQLNSLVRVETADGEAHAMILKGYPRPGKTLQATCMDCPGEFKGQPLTGLRFMWGLKRVGREWQDGQILDPIEGKIYRARVILSEDGRTMTVRGYLGVPLFGRSQIWRRYDGPAAD